MRWGIQNLIFISMVVTGSICREFKCGENLVGLDGYIQEGTFGDGNESGRSIGVNLTGFQCRWWIIWEQFDGIFMLSVDDLEAVC